MFRLILASFMLLLSFSSPVFASFINTHEISVLIDDAGLAETSVDLHFADLTTEEIYYFVFARIDSLEASDDYGMLLCNTKIFSYGTQITCKPNTEDKYNYSVHFDFNMLDLQYLYDENFLFSYDYSVKIPTGRFAIQFVLPVGMALMEKEEGFSPYSPEGCVVGSTEDGRHITVTWTEGKPSLGSDHSYRAFYEQVTLISSNRWFYPVVSLLALLLVFVSLILFRSRKSRKMNTVLSVLHEGERKVIELLMGGEGTCDQRVLVKETGFSKAKMSRIILDLEERGLVTKIRRGRTNIISLSEKKLKS
ncbi:MAG: hypothetical protein U9O53_02810 [archaeon]|nr:hypothetical protein [archaeon]